MFNKVSKLYSLLGKALCGCAGGIVGMVLGGPLLVVPGLFVGAVGGHVLEKNLMPVFLK